MRKFVAFIFAALLATDVFAATYEVDGFVFSYQDSYWRKEYIPERCEATLTAYNGSATDVRVPSHFSALIRYEDANSSEYKSILRTIYVTRINSQVFKGNTSIKSIVLPDTISYVERDAFSGCNALEFAEIHGRDLKLDNTSWMFYNCSGLRRVVFGDGVKTLPPCSNYDGPFAGAVSLEEIIVASSAVTSVPWGFLSASSAKAPRPNKISFAGEVKAVGRGSLSCSSLTNLTIRLAEGCVIDGSAFLNCPAVTAATIDFTKIKTIGNEAFACCHNLTGEVNLANATVIGEMAFRECERIDSVKCGDKLKTISAHAFMSCKGLASIDLGQGLEYLGSGAFGGCLSLMAIKTPTSLKTLGGSAFSGCTALIEATIDGNQLNLTEARDLFMDCSNLRRVIFTDGVVALPRENGYDGPFAGAIGLEEITVLSTAVTNVPNRFLKANYVKDPRPKTVSFAGEISWVGRDSLCCSALTNLTIRLADGCVIGDNAFANCPGVNTTSIDFSKIVKIGKSAFYSCTNIVGPVDISQTTQIGEKAFAYCREITDVALSSELKRIDAEAFSFCSGLKAVDFPDNLTYIGYGAFRGCAGLHTVCTPEHLSYLGFEAFYGCTELESAELKGENLDLSAAWRLFHDCTSLRRVIFGDGVTALPGGYDNNGPFANATALEEISVGVSVTSVPKGFLSANTMYGTIKKPTPRKVSFAGEISFVGYYALGGTSVKDLTIHLADGCVVEGEAFAGCPGVNTSTIDFSKIGSLGSSAFSSCTNIVGAIELTHLTEISNYAFYGCSGIEEVFAGENLTSIGSSAFAGCTNTKEYTFRSAPPETRDRPFGSDIGAKGYYLPKHKAAWQAVIPANQIWNNLHMGEVFVTASEDKVGLIEIIWSEIGTKYDLYRRKVQSGELEKIAENLSRNSYVDKSMAMGCEYEYVAAESEPGLSAPSEDAIIGADFGVARGNLVEVELPRSGGWLRGNGPKWLKIKSGKGDKITKMMIAVRSNNDASKIKSLILDDSATDGEACEKVFDLSSKLDLDFHGPCKLSVYATFDGWGLWPYLIAECDINVYYNKYERNGNDNNPNWLKYWVEDGAISPSEHDVLAWIKSIMKISDPEIDDRSGEQYYDYASTSPKISDQYLLSGWMLGIRFPAVSILDISTREVARELYDLAASASEPIVLSDGPEKEIGLRAKGVCNLVSTVRHEIQHEENYDVNTCYENKGRMIVKNMDNPTEYINLAFVQGKVQELLAMIDRMDKEGFQTDDYIYDENDMMAAVSFVNKYNQLYKRYEQFFENDRQWFHDGDNQVWRVDSNGKVTDNLVDATEVGDGVRDDVETGWGLNTERKDTFGISKVSKDFDIYIDIGDDEYLARKAEKSDGAVPENDWGFPGFNIRMPLKDELVLDWSNWEGWDNEFWTTSGVYQVENRYVEIVPQDYCRKYLFEEFNSDGDNQEDFISRRAKFAAAPIEAKSQVEIRIESGSLENVSGYSQEPYCDNVQIVRTSFLIDKQANALVQTLVVNSEFAMDKRIKVKTFLANARDELVISAKISTTLSPGENVITVTFPGADIYRTHKAMLKSAFVRIDLRRGDRPKLLATSAEQVSTQCGYMDFVSTSASFVRSTADISMLDGDVAVSIPIDNRSGGEYSLSGVLMDAEGRRISTAITNGAEDGEHSVTLVFNGLPVYLSGAQGPYEIKELVLKDANGNAVDTMACAGRIDDVDASCFRSPNIPVTILKDTLSFSEIARSFKGIVESLDATVEVENNANEVLYCRIRAYIDSQSSDRSVIAEAAVEVPIGCSLVEFSLPCTEFVRRGVQGPYTIRTIRFDFDDHSKWSDCVHDGSTIDLRVEDFGGTPIDESIVRPTIEGDGTAEVTGDVENGFVVKPSEGTTEVVITIPEEIAAEKVTVVVSPTVETIKANGVTIKVVKGAADITAFLDIPAAVDGVVNLGAAEVKEAIVKETLDPTKGAVIELSAENPTLTTAETKPGLTYTLFEGTTLDSMGAGASKLGDGTAWTPDIKVKGGASAFYSIRVTK